MDKPNRRQNTRHLYADLTSLRIQVQDLTSILDKFYEALEGLSISGERTGPGSIRYLDGPEQIRGLRTEIERLKNIIFEETGE